MFTARYGLGLQIGSLRFVSKGLIRETNNHRSILFSSVSIVSMAAKAF